MCREVRGCMLEEFAWRVYNAMLGRAVRGMRGVKPMDKRWIQCAEESRRALLKRYPAAGEAELREFCAAAGRFGQIMMQPLWGSNSPGMEYPSSPGIPINFFIFSVLSCFKKAAAFTPAAL